MTYFLRLQVLGRCFFVKNLQSYKAKLSTFTAYLK